MERNERSLESAASLPLSLRRRIATGLLWQIAGTGGDRLLRLVANIVLARLLSPHDFGLVGMAAAALAAVEALTFFATDAAIISSDHGRERRYLGTVFLASLIRGVLLAGLLLATAPLQARFFGAPEAASLFAAMALVPLVMGASSPAAILLWKDLRLGPWTTYRLVCSVVGIAITIWLAVALRSAWALVLGQVVTAAAVAVGSHVVAPISIRPAFDRSQWRRIRAFALGAAGTPLLLVLIAQAPALFLGRWSGPAVLGAFILAQRLAEMPVRLTVQVVGRVLVPAFSTIKDDAARTRRLWLTALRTVSLGALPVAAMIGWMGNDLPRLLFGSAYDVSAATFLLLAVAGAFAMPLAVTGALFWGAGAPDRDRRVQLLRVAVLFGPGLVLSARYGTAGLGAGLALSAFASLLFALVLSRRLVAVMWTEIGAAFLPGAIVAASVTGALLALDASADPTGWTRIGLGGSMAGAITGLATWTLRRRRVAASDHIELEGTATA